MSVFLAKLQGAIDRSLKRVRGNGLDSLVNEGIRKERAWQVVRALALGWTLADDPMSKAFNEAARRIYNDDKLDEVEKCVSVLALLDSLTAGEVDTHPYENERGRTWFANDGIDYCTGRLAAVA